MFFGFLRSKKKKLIPLKAPGQSLTKFDYFIVALVGVGCSIYTWYPFLTQNPELTEADKLTLCKHLITAPGTKFIVKTLFKVTVYFGACGMSYKLWSASRYRENRANGMFLSDLEERRIAESQQKNY